MGPDGSRRPSCSPRAAPRPRSPASSACPARARLSGTPAMRRVVWMVCAAGGPTGPDPKLSAAQLATVEQALLQGDGQWVRHRLVDPRTHHGGDRPADRGSVSPWACVGDPAPASRLDAAAAGAAGQRADEEAIARWVAHEWPRIKRAAAESAWIVFFDESAVSLIPPVRRTWSPRGRTPILRHRFGWKKASMAAALGYRPDGTAARLCFHLQQPAMTTASSGSWTSSGPSTPASEWC